MKGQLKILFFFLLCLTLSRSYSQVLESDSLSLVSLYNSTDGDNWTVSWDIQNSPVNSWFGINLSPDGTRVIGLTLPNNLLIGTIPDSLYEITKLQTLNLSGNNLTGEISENINQLDSLSILNFSNNQLSDSLPDGLTGLLNLTTLDLSRNDFIGSMPESIGNLIKLQVLDLSENSISGQLPQSIADLESLTQLYLNNNNITGNVPGNINRLINLNELNLSSNQLSGSIPDSLYYIKNLHSLNLSQNLLGGSISSRIEELDSIEFLNLSNNALSDTIPEEISDLNKLLLIDISNNELTGPIPSTLGLLDNIETIRLNNNKLSGTFPALLTSLDQLKVLNISFNDLSDSIPQSIINLKNLTNLNLSDNNFNNLPDITDINNGGVPTLVDISNNAFTFEDIEPNISLFSLSQYYSPQATIGETVNLAIPLGGADTIYTVTGGQFNIYEWVKDTTLKKTNENFYSFQNFQLGDTGIYRCFVSNTLVPDLILEREPFRILVRVSQQDRDALVAIYNSTDGENWDITWDFELPVSLWHGITVKNERVTSINLGSNNLNGFIPDEIKVLGELTSLRLSNNDISGEIPDSLVYLGNLEILDLSSNHIADSIEFQFDSLTKIKQLILSENQLSGNLPVSFNSFSDLEILDLSVNDLNGKILLNIDSLPFLEEFDVSDNRITGNFPDIALEHQNLKIFHINDNRITGEIPGNISNMKNLENLDISDNNLSGQIPGSLSEIITLRELRLFGNSFNGRIPDNFSSLVNLETFYMNNNAFSGLPDLRIGNLEELRVYNNRLTFKDVLPNLLFFIDRNRKEEFIWEPQESNIVIPTLFLNTGMDTVLISPDITEGNTYFWTKDGVATGNSSATYEIDSVGFRDSGIYTCRVTNTIIEELGFSNIFFDFIFSIEVNPVNPVVEIPEPFCIGSSKVFLKTDLIEPGLSTIWFRRNDMNEVENLGQGPMLTYDLKENLDTVYVFNKVGNLNSDTLLIPVFLRPEIYQTGDSLLFKGFIEGINYLWYYEQDLIDSAITYIQPENTGNYYVQAVHNKCSSTSEPYFFSPDQTGKIITGIEDQGFRNTIAIYPNPAADFVNIDINFPVEDKIIINWLDAQGRIISEDVIDPNGSEFLQEFSTVNFKKGLHFLIITISDKKSIHKVIIQ